MQIRYEGLTDCGLKRKVNQDHVGMFVQGGAGLFLVADGMGGYSDGEAASQLIVYEMGSWWEKNCLEVSGGDIQSEDFQEIVEDLRQKILAVNRKILEVYNQDQVCGSTLVMLLIVKRFYAVFSVGDSRIYTTKGKKLLQMTKDDVWENLNSTIERYSPEEILHHPNRGKLAQSIGALERIFINIQTGECGTKQVFLLCSDGIYKMCSEHMIRIAAMAWKSEKNADQCLSNLKKAVYAANAPDNLSVILVSVKKDSFYRRINKKIQLIK